jgi:hypothetical protein
MRKKNWTCSWSQIICLITLERKLLECSLNLRKNDPNNYFGHFCLLKSRSSLAWRAFTRGLRPSGWHKDAECEQTSLPREINGFRLRSKPKTNWSQIRLPEESWQTRCWISLAWWCDDVQVHPIRVWQGWWGARHGRELFWRGLVGYLSCRGPGSHPTSLEAPRVQKDVGVNRKGDANPAHLPRLGSLLYTWICAINILISWIACGATWIRHPALAIGGASWTLTLSSTSSTRPRLEKAVLNDLFPDNPFSRLIAY